MPTQKYNVPAQAAPGMSLEEMKAFVKNHFEQFVNRKDSSIAFHSFSDDFLDHDEPTGYRGGTRIG